MDEEELRAWRSLHRAHSDIVSSVDRELTNEHGLGLPDYEVLRELSEASDRNLRMTELARSVMLSPSGLTRRLDGLVKRGYVERQPCPSDGRGLLAVLTDLGVKQVEQLAPTYVEGVRRHFVDCLSRSQIEQLISIFEPIVLDQQTCDPPSVDTDERQPVTASQ